MANNYLKFSFDFIVPEQVRSWLNDVIFAMDEAHNMDCDLKQLNLLEEVFESSLAGCAEFPDGPEFDIDFDIDTGVCWIHAEEYGNVDQVAYLLAAILEKSEGTELDRIGFTYSETCSSPRANEFGGGWHVVYLQDGEAFHNGGNAYNQMQDALGG